MAATLPSKSDKMPQDQKTYADYPEVWEEEEKCNSEAHGEELGALSVDPKSSHYDSGGIETIEIIKAKLTKEQYEGFCLGNMLKYACRANWKGDFDRDIEKSGYYRRFLAEARGDK